ncbi:MAG: TldD/PmbA family protein [Sulfolobales archaeon]|nr:TldD/PmbA family protein [Sulfolobales archaeon]
MELKQEFVEKALDKALSLGALFAVVRFHVNKYELITVDSGFLRQYSYTIAKGMGIEVYTSSGRGYAYTSDLSWESINKTIERSISIARAVSSKKLEVAFGEAAKKISFNTSVKKDPLSIDPHEKIELLMDLNKLSLSHVGITSSITNMGIEVDHRLIASSDGGLAESNIVGVGIAHMAVGKVGLLSERVYDSESFIGGYEYIEERDWESFVNELSKLAIEASKAKTPSPGAYSAVLDNELVGLFIHEAFGHASEGDLVRSGSSILSGRLGEKVGSEQVTIVDEGLVDGGYPVPFDDECTPKKKTIVVENGVLKKYLTSRIVATFLNNELTGNARAMNFTYDPIVRQTNFYIEPGDFSLEELFEDVDYGIYLRGRGAMGGQVDPSIGTFTFHVGPSYILRRGEVGELVRGVIVSGNILDVLNNVDAVAKDLKIRTSVFGGCGKENQLVRVGDGGPHVRVRKIIVGGELESARVS